jgi:hypothetical protein
MVRMLMGPAPLRARMLRSRAPRRSHPATSRSAMLPCNYRPSSR